MTIARIIEEQRKTTQSGKSKAGRWTLEFERTQAQQPDPLTGWAGSGDTRTQVRLVFDSKEEALAYATRNGFEYSRRARAAGQAQDPGLRRQFSLGPGPSRGSGSAA